MENVAQKSTLKDSVKAEQSKALPKRPAERTKKPEVKAQVSKATDSKTGKSAKSAKSAPKDQVKDNGSHRKSEKKHSKIKVVRDSFTMPEKEYAEIAALKKKCLAAGVAVKKSELMRAGLKALSEMTQANLNKQLAKLDPIKMGRPAKTVH